MGNPILQQLSRDYASGDISRHEYLILRTALIDYLTGETSQSEHEPDPQATVNDETPKSPGALRQKTRLILAAIVAISVILFMITREDTPPAHVKSTAKQYSSLPDFYSRCGCSGHLLDNNAHVAA